MTNDEFADAVAEFNANAKPELTTEVNDEVLQFATEIFDYVDNELEGGFWHQQFAALTEAQKVGLFKALADAFNDTTEN
jgi:hypothetical protein